MVEKPLGASTVFLPEGNWQTVYQALCARFPNISPAVWQARFHFKKVLNSQLQPLSTSTAYQQGAQIFYFREVDAEPEVPFQEQILYENEHLLVVDKPHFLVVAPVGMYVEQSLLRRLQHKTGNADLVPIHRLDRVTAGLVLFAKTPIARDAYHALFRSRAVTKRYQALAKPLPDRQFPFNYSSHITKGEPFFRMREGIGEVNSETRLEVLAKMDNYWHYALYPVTGKKHQLRVHMAALGAPILNDEFYPVMAEQETTDFSHPLKLLASDLSFFDPFTKEQQHFSTQLSLF
ncbi:pseudouridine synthase [Pseudomonas sp. F1_0610]|uniref:pseudouridine synthase n=1 Tax=Pseudomonas sp. F1_0610 TaxID=3114284 RepID=UPI0039C267B5